MQLIKQVKGLTGKTAHEPPKYAGKVQVFWTEGTWSELRCQSLFDTEAEALEAVTELSKKLLDPVFAKTIFDSPDESQMFLKKEVTH